MKKSIIVTIAFFFSLVPPATSGVRADSPTLQVEDYIFLQNFLESLFKANRKKYGWSQSCQSQDVSFAIMDRISIVSETLSNDLYSNDRLKDLSSNERQPISLVVPKSKEEIRKLIYTANKNRISCDCLKTTLGRDNQGERALKILNNIAGRSETGRELCVN